MAEQSEEMAAGVVSTASGAPGMVAYLHRMNEAVMTQTPPGFVITSVQSEADLQDFKRVLVTAYEMPAKMADGWVQAALALGIERTPWQMLVGRLDGEAVATNMLFVGGGVAGIFGVATVPEARGKGIGAAISLAPLLQARALGVRYAALFATEMAIRVYERIGFQLTDVRLNRYLWRNG
jgi:GNAT superfamily N-acetyltransferase